MAQYRSDQHHSEPKRSPKSGFFLPETRFQTLTYFLISLLISAPVQAAQGNISCPSGMQFVEKGRRLVQLDSAKLHPTSMDQIPSSQAASRSRKRPGLVPVKPLGNQPLGFKEMTVFGCKREFAYQGKTYLLDSIYAEDGEGLRPIFGSTSSAIAELNAYQKAKDNARVAAYAGSIGLVLALAGFLYGRFNQNPTQTSNTIRSIGVIGGLGLTLTAGIYGFSAINRSGRKLESAVSQFNQAHPNQKIQLQLSAKVDL